VNRIQKTLVLIAAIAVPAAAHSTFAPPASLCFASGSTTFRLAPDAAAPDYRIRIERSAAQADLRMQLVDRAELADFTLVDDFKTPQGTTCQSPAPIQTVKIDNSVSTPDVVVSLAADAGADYKVYVHSVRFSQQDAAAMLAAMWKANQRRALAARATP
jgi:hypothetical protein